jgi:putative FmdB family regulatory protein
MPIYGYRCASCGHELEVLQSMRDAPLTVCENCGGPLVKKLYPVGVQFKGTGFYSTDYKRSKENIANGKSESKSDGKSGASDGKTDTAASSSTDGGKAEKSASGEKATSKAADA